MLLAPTVDETALLQRTHLDRDAGMARCVIADARSGMALAGSAFRSTTSRIRTTGPSRAQLARTGSMRANVLFSDCAAW